MGVNLKRFHFRNLIVQFIDICFARQNRCFVVFIKSCFNHTRIVYKIQNKRIIFIWCTAVQTGKCLNCFNIRKPLIHIHRMQQRFIKTGLKLIRNNQNPVRVFLKGTLDFGACKTIQIRFGNFPALILGCAREGNDRLIRTFTLFQKSIDCFIVFDGARDSTGNHHGTGSTANFSTTNHFCVEMLYNDARLLLDCILIGFHIIAEQPLRLLFIKERIILNRFGELIKALDRSIIA